MFGYEKKVKCYNDYFVNGYVFHTELYDNSKRTFNNRVCVKGTISNELEVDHVTKNFFPDIDV